MKVQGKKWRRPTGLCLMMTFICLDGWGCSAEAPPAAAQSRPIHLYQVKAGASEEGQRVFSGTISAGLQADLAFPIPGTIVRLAVTEGQQVKAGDVIAQLDDREARSQLGLAEARANLARQELDRSASLVAAQAAAGSSLDRAKAQMGVDAAQLAMARKNLADTLLRAPFDGVIARRVINDLRVVRPSEVVAVLQDQSKLEVRFEVPEGFAVLAQPGLSLEERNDRIRLTAELSSLPGKVFPARLTQFASRADPATRTFTTTVAVERPSGVTVLPGMTARVTIEPLMSAGTRVVTVPVQAVVADEGRRPYVWLVHPETGAVSRKNVELGAPRGDSLEIRKGLAVGDRIALTGVHALRDGMVVRELRWPQSSPAPAGVATRP